MSISSTGLYGSATISTGLYGSATIVNTDLFDDVRIYIERERARNKSIVCGNSFVCGICRSKKA